MTSRPRPVLVYMAVMAGLSALTTYSGLDQLIPKQAMLWLGLVTVVVGAAGGVIVQGQVTPLSAPQAKDGRPLVPTPPAKVPPWTDPEQLDATRPVDEPADTGQALPGLTRDSRRAGG